MKWNVKKGQKETNAKTIQARDLPKPFSLFSLFFLFFFFCLCFQHHRTSSSSLWSIPHIPSIQSPNFFIKKNQSHYYIHTLFLIVFSNKLTTLPVLKKIWKIQTGSFVFVLLSTGGCLYLCLFWHFLFWSYIFLWVWSDFF